RPRRGAARADQPRDRRRGVVVTAPVAARPVGDIVDLPDRVLDSARRDPDRVALVHVGRPVLGRSRVRTTTYARLSHRAEATAVGLRELGIGEGTTCSFMVPPGEDAMVLALALWRVGAVIVGIEPHSHGFGTVARCLAR